MEKLGETSEDDEEELDIDVKEEEEDDEEDDDDDEDKAQAGGGRGAYGRAMVVGGVSTDAHADRGNRFLQQQQQQHPQLGGGSDADHQQQQMMMLMMGAGGSGGMRRCRPKEEKERTKLRERHRRAITARILSGLRRHGNYNLRVRADINEVIGALAREAGWTVLPDGTTFPSRPNNSQVRPRLALLPLPSTITHSPTISSSSSASMEARGFGGERGARARRATVIRSQSPLSQKISGMRVE